MKITGSLFSYDFSIPEEKTHFHWNFSMLRKDTEHQDKHQKEDNTGIEKQQKGIPALSFSSPSPSTFISTEP